MMKFKEFSFVSYAITDLKRSRDFYEGVLGLEASSVFGGNGYAFVEYEIGPDTLAIGMGSSNFTPGKMGATVALEFDGDFDVALKELERKNVKILMERYDGPSCTMVLIEDPDGNQIMVHKRKKK